MNTLPTDNCLSNNDSNIPAKVLSPNDPRLKEISQQIYNLLAFRNKPEVIAYDLQGYYGTNVEGLMKEYGFDKNSFQSFFTQLGYQFDSKGRFLLPSVAPTLVKTFRFMTAYPRIQEIEIVSENFFTSCNNRRYLLRHEFPYHQQNDDDDEEDFPFFGDNGLNGYNGALVQPHNGQQPDVNNGFGGGGGGAADTGEIRGSDLLVIFRNLRPPPTGVKIVDDQWIDIKYNDIFPKKDIIMAADNRQLKQEDGRSMFQYVALWYKHGNPVFGRAFPSEAEKVLAHFGWDNQENAGPEIGSLQMLALPPPKNRGMEYKWQPFGDALKNAGGFRPVHVGDSAPCILKDAKGVERLGNVHLKNEKASVGAGGKEIHMVGPAVQDLLVLCRNP